jgi:menaquinone-specific isochorismate synthase
MTLINWLRETADFPKLYWRSKDGMEYAASGQKSQGSLQLGGMRFFSTPSYIPKDLLWDSFPSSAFWIPKEEKTHIDSLQYIATQNPSHSPSLSLPSQQQWSAFVQNALQTIAQGLFQKVVLARRSTFEGHFDPFSLLQELKAYSQGATLFGLAFSKKAFFLGASPEHLYRRIGRQIEVDALAGTKTRGAPFLSTDREEFAHVKHSIEEALAPLCTHWRWQAEDSVHETALLSHIHNRLRAELRTNVDDRDLLDALHPTAALGGFPKKPALDYLAKHEPFERGWYGAPLGFCTREKAEFIVAIRSALVTEEALYAFAGGGIVKGSDPEKEWEERNQKIALIGNLISASCFCVRNSCF